MRALFEISEDLNFLHEFLTDADGDVTEEALEAEIDKWLADLGEERDNKIDNYCALYRELEARAEARKAEADRIARLSSIDAGASARLKARLFNFFTTHGLTKVETLRFRVSVSGNGGQLPLIIDEDMLENPSKLPTEYRQTFYAPNRDKIVEDLNLLETARLNAENKKGAWDSLLHEIELTRKALSIEPGNAALTELLDSQEALAQDNFKEYDEAQAVYEKMQTFIPFAKFGVRGKHLRIK